MAIRKSDYENYDYQEFWKEGKRLYEDRAERLALRKFLKGVKEDSKLFLDVGCGYGRLFNEYKNFKNIILVDYSLKNLKTARDNIGKFLKFDSEKLFSSMIYFIAADASCLPLKSECADVVLTVRVVHHLNYPEKYFDEVARVLKNEGLYFLEFANKRNLKNILKYIIGRMHISPFNLIPSQVGETILNFHPKYIISLLKSRGFTMKELISMSNFRLEFFKKHIGVELLLFFEKLYQRFFSFAAFGPSIFLKSTLRQEARNANLTSSSSDNSLIVGDSSNKKLVSKKDYKIRIENILICPYCKKDSLIFSKNKISCRSCGRHFLVEDGIYNFKV